MAVAQRHFPHDITTLIIDILGDGLLDPHDTDCCPALANCLLVSRTFCHHSRRHLFRAVSLQNSPVDSFFERVAQLREIMAPRSNPQLGMISYIKVFSVEMFKDPSKTVYRKNGPGLATILKAFIRFESHLEEFNFWGCNIQWKRLGQTVHNLIRSIVRSPSLSTIHLFGLDGVPVSVLTGATCKNLRLRSLKMGKRRNGRTSTLNLENIPQLQPEAFVTDNTFPLEYLSSNGPRAELPNVSTSPFSHLKKLVMEISITQKCRDVPIVLLEAMGSLQEMDIVLRTGGWSHPKFIFPTIDIGRLPKLRVLRLQQQHWSQGSFRSTFPPENSPSMASILHPTVPCISLERLDLHFETHDDAEVVSPLRLHEARIWRNIDALLSPSQFPSLKRVSLLFGMSLYMPGHLGPSARAEFLADAVPRLREAFPLLSISNSIEFTVEIRGISGTT